MRQPLGDAVAHDDHRRPQQVARSRASQSDRACARNVYHRARANTGADRSMETGRKYVGQAREILDLGHGLVFVREPQDVEIGVRDHHVLGLAADPTTHVDITVGSTGTGAG